jgi:hypothetical protein
MWMKRLAGVLVLSLAAAVVPAAHAEHLGLGCGPNYGYYSGYGYTPYAGTYSYSPYGYGEPAGAYYGPGYGGYYYPPGGYRDPYRGQRRVNNFLIGAGLINEIANRGSSRRGIRSGILGGLLLNNLFNRPSHGYYDY